MAVHLVQFPRWSVGRPATPRVLNPDSDQANGLLLWAACDGMVGAFRDRSPYQRPWTITTAATALSGDPIAGLGWDFSTGQIDYPDAPELDVTDLTVAVWLRSDVVTSLKSAVTRSSSGISNSGDWVLGNGGSDSTYRFIFRNSGGTVSAQSGTGFAINTPTCLTGVIRAQTVAELYVNGQLTASASGAGTLGATAELLRLASRASASQAWDGKIFDVKVWNRALSPGEILALYDPQTRWDLYWQPSQRVFFNIGAGAAYTPRLALLGVG